MLRSCRSTHARLAPGALDLLLTASAHDASLPARAGGRYYGWPMLYGLSLAEMVSWGVVYYSFSVFIRPMEEELGWSRAQVTGAFSLALAVSGLAAIPVGHWLDARGPRALMTTGSLLATLLLVAWSYVDSLLGLCLIWSGLGLTMAAVLYEPAFAVVATWFVRERSRALLILTVFGGFASTIFVPLANALLARQGWRAAVLSLALVLALTTVPLHGLLLRRGPGDVCSGPDGDPVQPKASRRERPDRAWHAALGSSRFWALAATFSLSSFAIVAAGVHLIPCLLERGVSPATAAATVGLIGAMQVPGRLLFASVFDRLGPRAATASVFLLQAGALAALPSLSSGAALAAVAGALGMGNGMATLLRASSVADAFQSGDYGKISGGVALFASEARAAGPLGAALAYSALHDYRGVYFGLAVLMGLAGLIASLTVPSPTRSGEQVAA